MLAVGAEATAPAGLTLPLEMSATIGGEIGWNDGQTFAVPIREFVAPRVSNPTVAEGVTASASAWVEARSELNFSVAGVEVSQPLVTFFERDAVGPLIGNLDWRTIPPSTPASRRSPETMFVGRDCFLRPQASARSMMDLCSARLRFLRTTTSWVERT